MRPDAHKQKASRRYQATHDMAATAGRGGSTPKRGGRGGSATLPTTTAARRAQHPDPSAQGNNEQDNPFAEELESDGSKAKAFWTRRRVVDNSFRFEGEPPSASDDDDIDENVPGQDQDAGAKAAKLLAERIERTEQRSRTDAGAFKFKDEEAWDQVRESAGGPDADLGAITTLDLSQLDASLASIPLATRIPAVTAFIPSTEPATQPKVSAQKPPSSRTKSRSRSRNRDSTAPVAAKQQPVATTSAAVPPMTHAQPPRAPSPSKSASVAKTSPAAPVARPVEKKPAEVSKVTSMEAWLDDFLDD